MYREILQILRCPKCNEELALITEKEEDSEIIAGKLKCKNNHCWQISEGVINFQSVEQEQFNNWTESYKEYNYEEMDEKILKGLRNITVEVISFVFDEFRDYALANFIMLHFDNI